MSPIRVVPDPPGIFLDEVELFPNGKSGDTRLMTETQHRIFQLEIQLEHARDQAKSDQDKISRYVQELSALKRDGFSPENEVEA